MVKDSVRRGAVEGQRDADRMKLGSLFKAIVKLPIIPAAVIADIATLGAFKTGGDEFLTEKVIARIADDLDDVTE